MSTRERRSIDNAVWLCQNCAKLVDSDVTLYNSSKLLEWKEDSEARALKEISEASPATATDRVREPKGLRQRLVVELGDNNSFSSDPEDLKNLATRCAIASIEGVLVDFEVRLSPTVIRVQPSDPLLLPRYEKRRAAKADELSRLLSILTAPSTHEWWRYSLLTVDDWALAIGALIARASTLWCGVGGHKLDLWRTEEPRLVAAIYLEHDELQRALCHLGLESTQYLRFGPNWRAASDLPRDLVAKHVIPRLVFEIDQHSLVPGGSVLNLLEWHIGDG